MAGSKWYGVATLYGYMVCNDWSEAERYLKVHSGVEMHHKFSTMEEAEEFGKTNFKKLTGVLPSTFQIGLRPDSPAEVKGVPSAGPVPQSSEYEGAGDSPPW